VLGLVREIVAKNYFGVQGPVNAFQIAFLVPNTIRALVADAALSSAFVPVFSDLIEKGERKRAWRVASTLFWLTLLGLGTVTALFVLIAPWVMPPLYPHHHALLIGLSQVLFPIVALLGVSGIIVGILNTYDEFSVPALTPVAWNLVIIAGLVFGVPHVHGVDHKLYVRGIGTVLEPDGQRRRRTRRARLVPRRNDRAARGRGRSDRRSGPCVAGGSAARNRGVGSPHRRIGRPNRFWFGCDVPSSTGALGRVPRGRGR